MNQVVDFYFSNNSKWQNEITLLRALVLDCNLNEELKWRVPCYTHQGKNILIVSAFKNYCSINFFKGSLLSDYENILEKPGDNSFEGRLIKFTHVAEIEKLKATIKAYIFEAIEIEKAGIKFDNKAKSQIEFPIELQNIFEENQKLKEAFISLTPGRQRGYLLHFSQAKQSKTIITRIEKYIPRILLSKGINDCVCGYSKKMPNCDGSHKVLDKKPIF
jgi:uncharacterized protein YdeI (YjbR/CyaY-like superfamily)